VLPCRQHLDKQRPGIIEHISADTLDAQRLMHSQVPWAMRLVMQIQTRRQANDGEHPSASLEP